MSLREKTKDLHDALEALPFNVRMFKGEHTQLERQLYLSVQMMLFASLDTHMDDEGFHRISAIEKDLKNVGGFDDRAIDITFEYVNHLVETDNINPHIYLNYMGFMYGGQIMKKRYPGTASMYEFDEIEAKRQFIREEICEDTDEFVEEVREGYIAHIRISKELERVANMG
jgi:hypothetical protein